MGLKHENVEIEIELWPRKVRHNKYELVNAMGVKGVGTEGENPKK